MRKIETKATPVLTESRLQALQELVWQLYGSISQFYVVADAFIIFPVAVEA